MNLLVRNRQITTPSGYAERECFLVSYQMPFFNHCFALCHDSSAENQPDIDLSIMSFFISEAHALSLRVTGNTQSFVMIQSGNIVRKRQNLHLHVFVISRRWHKAWLYILLSTIHTSSAARRAVLKLIGRKPAPMASGPEMHAFVHP